MGTEMFCLKGKHALVTGGGSGMGRAISIAYADSGAEVIVSDINLQGAEETAELIRTNGGIAYPMYVNAADRESVNALAAAAKVKFGKVDVLMNCIGITAKAKPGESHIDQWTRVINVNLIGIFNCCEALGEMMIEQGAGSIINIASMTATLICPKTYPGRDGEYGLFAYTAAKTAVYQLTKAMALLWAEYGVRVNSISPGFIDTPLEDVKKMDPDVLAKRLARIPMNYVGQPDEVTGTVVYLASDASKYVTGVDILIDGGYACRR